MGLYANLHTAITASAITLSLGIGTLTTGTPQAATALGVTVSTTQDFASAGSASQALGGQVAVGTSLTLVAGDLVGSKATSGVVSIVFTAASVIPTGGTITINTPFNYFANRTAGAAVGTSSITCATACTNSAVGNVAVTNTAASGPTAAFGSPICAYRPCSSQSLFAPSLRHACSSCHGR